MTSLTPSKHVDGISFYYSLETIPLNAPLTTQTRKDFHLIFPLVLYEAETTLQLQDAQNPSRCQGAHFMAA